MYDCPMCEETFMNSDDRMMHLVKHIFEKKTQEAPPPTFSVRAITRPLFSIEALEIGLVAASTGKPVEDIITLCKEAELLLRSLRQ